MTLQLSAQESIHQFKVEGLTGEVFDFSSLKGKKVMVVNTASKCGLTPQYTELQKLHEMHGEDLVIVGFPANNFGKQEPGSNEEIKEFCSKNYGVEFPMMAKVSVKGDDMCDVYQFLTQKDKNGLEDSEVQWNFQKYLLDEEGKLVKVVSPTVKPMDKEILDWLN